MSKLRIVFLPSSTLHCSSSAFQIPAFGAGPEDALDRMIEFNITAHMALEDALIEWGLKVDVTVMINSRTANWQVTRDIHGSLSARKALTELLEGSGKDRDTWPPTSQRVSRVSEPRVAWRASQATCAGRPSGSVTNKS